MRKVFMKQEWKEKVSIIWFLNYWMEMAVCIPQFEDDYILYYYRPINLFIYNL